MNLSDYSFPPDAEIFVEAYHQTRWMRFPFGSVEDVAEPDPTTLSQFDLTEPVLFRVKVVSKTPESGKLLGLAEEIRPRLPNETIERVYPLLDVASEDLGERPWKLAFEPTRPTLYINRGLGDKSAVARTSEFQQLVYPQIIKETLSYILLGEAYDSDEEDSWMSYWLRFAQSYHPGMKIPAVDRSKPDEFDLDEVVHWIDEVVNSFCAKRKVTKELVNTLRHTEI